MPEPIDATNDDPVVPREALLPAPMNPPAAVNQGDLAPAHVRFPHNLPFRLDIILGQNGVAYSIRTVVGNRYVLRVGSKQLNNVIRRLAHEDGINLRKSDLNDINNLLQAHAETACKIENVWYRVAPVPGGIEMDLGDDTHAHTRITSGRVEIITEGSETLFYRTPVSRPMAMPAARGDLKLLKKYLNLHAVSIVLFIAWLTYTLAHPKIQTTKFVILVLQGNQGSGKSGLCNVIQVIIDPSLVGVQILPSNGKDLAIAAQNAHVLFFDNVREIKPSISDTLCIAATGGALTARQLYTDADQQVHTLHAALVLNGIHSFIEQPDLAQRCLPLRLLPISESSRKSEAQIASELHADLPVILRGVFDLIANILTHLPTATITNPERMIDFVQWLAAMEMAQGAPVGAYQQAYSEALNQGQLDSLLENLLAAAVLEFAQDQVSGIWTGTPTELFQQLNIRATRNTQRSREWPQTPIALSKRLIPLEAGLLSQGVKVELGRGKFRTITIKSVKRESND